MRDLDTRVTALYRHPVKGLSPEPCDEVALVANTHFPGDRLFAFENGPSGFDPDAPEHLPKNRFLMLMRHEALARLKTRYDATTGMLSIMHGGALVAQGAPPDPEGRARLEAFFANYLGDALRQSPRLLTAPASHRFIDSRSGFVSIVNVASVTAIAAAAGRPRLDPRRFRANIVIEAPTPWCEFDWVGQTLSIGTARLEILKRIDRCAAIDVDPDVGVRDGRLVETMERVFRHHDCGVYARIAEGGALAVGNRVTLG